MQELDYIAKCHMKAVQLQYSKYNKQSAVSSTGLHTSVAKRLGVNARTVQTWSGDYRKITAAGAHYMARAVGFGGITFNNLTTELDCEFDEVLRVVHDAHRESGMTLSTLAVVLDLSGTAMARRYLNEDYATRNLTFIQLMRWALSVNLGHTTFHNKNMGSGIVVYGFNATMAEYKNDLPQEYDELVWDNPSAAAYAQVEPMLKPYSAPNHPSGTKVDHATYKRRGLVGATPTPAGLHLPLLMLVRVLRSEMQRQQLDTDSMFGVVDGITLNHWCEGTLLFHGRAARLDLTLRKLDAWCQKLGFGRLMCPTFGHDFNAAGRVILHNLTLADRLSPGAVGTLLGGKYNAAQLAHEDWMDMPAVFWEYLSIWAWADGLAFEKNAGHSGHVYKGWSPEQAAKAAAVARQRVADTVARLTNSKLGSKYLRDKTPSLRSMIVPSGGYKGGNAAIELLDFQSFDADIHHIAEHA